MRCDGLRVCSGATCEEVQAETFNDTLRLTLPAGASATPEKNFAFSQIFFASACTSQKVHA
jgi:hypothetical protein